MTETHYVVVPDGGGKMEYSVTSIARKRKKDDSDEDVNDNVDFSAKKKCRSMKAAVKLPYGQGHTKHNVRKTNASKVIHNKREFPYGSIVANPLQLS